MVPVLNLLGTDVACVGNHDLDFGVKQFQNLAAQCTFPWLLANVLGMFHFEWKAQSANSVLILPLGKVYPLQMPSPRSF
jgi:2',3'-cyclic-nucleotide 2'-phosphodiesterase (5'-nucleotidase family)